MIDIRQTEDGDIDLSMGDFAMVEPTGQHQRDILIAAPGYYKESPTVGVDSISDMLESDKEAYLRTVRRQFARDGMRVDSVKHNDYTGILQVEAEYESDKS